MNFSSLALPVEGHLPLFIDRAAILASLIREMSANDIRQLMNISGPLASQTKTRFMEWHEHHNKENAKPALFAFSGDVYDGLKAESFSISDIDFAQKHLIILSGFYGLLRPLDLMMPYRLEVGLKWETQYFRNLYQFWDKPVNEYFKVRLNETNNKTIINLASAEYFKMLDAKKLGAKVISPIFAELNGSKLKTVSLFAKKARGMMARFIILNKISNSEEIITFQEDRYSYIPEMSSENNPVFAR